MDVVLGIKNSNLGITLGFEGWRVASFGTSNVSEIEMVHFGAKNEIDSVLTQWQIPEKFL
jgi:hypothetical protein